MANYFKRTLRKILSKIILIFVTVTIIYSCSLVKRVPENKQLLIKNEIFVDEKIVKEERISNLLLQQPNNIAYIDTLAWGEYKIKNCKEANNQMKKVVDEVGLDDEEIKFHWEKIKECSSDIR